MTTATDEGWLAEAMRMPVAFAQVREDARVDLAVIDQLGRSGLSGLMIASGGCNAATLVASGRFDDLHLVDANFAQLALARLKLHLLQHATPTRRAELLGHAPCPTRAEGMTSLLIALELSAGVLGPRDLVARLGPDHVGRYELLFTRLREQMITGGADWPEVLRRPDAAEAAAPGTPLGRVLDESFERVMALENLVALFGAAATQNSVEPFSRHFARRTRIALATPSAAGNPFLWQLLVGRFPPGVQYDWLTLPPPSPMPRLTWSHAAVSDVLAAAGERRYDFVHLSNILDWLTPVEAADVLRLAYRALRPGGRTIVRQLNSSLDLPRLGGAFEWLTEEADALHRVDRSFFYRRLHLGRRR